MKTLRNGVFETNSSSCHCLSLVKKDELRNFASNQSNMCIYLPDTGEYRTGNTYKIMARDVAFEQYNRDYNKYNHSDFVARFPDMALKVYPETDEGQDEWEKDLDNDCLPRALGLYLSFAHFMEFIIVDSDLRFDVTWWNNND